MNIIFKILVAVILLSCTQDYGTLKLQTSLPKKLNEISGLAKQNDKLWMINDSNNSPVVFEYNISEKKITRIHPIKNATNKDWEDLTTDPDGNLYIGDFGNNKNKRKDLVIYKTNVIHKQKIEKIKFTLEDQTKFPPKKKNLNYDIEAFFYLEDSLYLWTRNRSSNFDGISKLYKLPATPGTYIAKKIGVFKTCTDKNDCQITSAAIHNASKKIALLSYNKVWIIKNYKEPNFLDGDIIEIKLGHTSQKESIAFKDENTLYIADERSGPIGRNLYSLDISNIK